MPFFVQNVGSRQPMLSLKQPGEADPQVGQNGSILIDESTISDNDSAVGFNLSDRPPYNTLDQREGDGTPTDSQDTLVDDLPHDVPAHTIATTNSPPSVQEQLPSIAETEAFYLNVALPVSKIRVTLLEDEAPAFISPEESDTEHTGNPSSRSSEGTSAVRSDIDIERLIPHFVKRASPQPEEEELTTCDYNEAIKDFPELCRVDHITYEIGAVDLPSPPPNSYDSKPEKKQKTKVPKGLQVFWRKIFRWHF